MLWALFEPWGGDRSESLPCHVVGIIRTLGIEIALSHRHVVGIIRTLG